MAFFRGLLDAIRIDRTPYQPALLEFPTIDPIKLRQELALEKRGTEHGAQNQPAPDHAGFDHVEWEIVALIEKAHQDADEFLANNLEVYAGRLARLDNKALADRVQREFDDAMVDFKTGVSTDSNRLYLLKKNVLEMEEEYDDFRRKHGLNRIAKYPAHWLQNVSIVLLFALVETIANAVFFSQTHPRGWAGAVFEAVFISVINTAVGFGVGYVFLRGWHHPRFLVKSFSFLISIGFITLLIGFNIFAAHYRDAFTTIPLESLAQARDAASIEAFERLKRHLWILVGFQSYLMVAIGLIVSGVAMLEGYRFDDPFPGFGAIARHREKIVTRYAQEKERLLSGLKERKDEALRAIDYIIDESTRRDEEYAIALEARRSMVGRYNGFLAHLKSAGNQLLEVYRTANRSARKLPAPSVFAKPWEPKWLQKLVPKEDDSSDRSSITTDLLKRLTDARGTFLAAYEHAVEQYQRIDQIVSKEALDHARPEVG